MDWLQADGVDDSFIANLAGDWLARVTGLPSTLDTGIVRQNVAQTIARNQKPFFPMPTMQVTSKGESKTSTFYSLQDEPYLGCEAIYNNYVDDGMETIRRLYICVWEENQSPWDESLCYDAPGGRKGWLYTYMTSPTTWFVLDALGGTSIEQTWALITSPTKDQTIEEDTDGMLTIPFASVTARYFRITNEGSDSPWWSIGEITAFGPPLHTANAGQTMLAPEPGF